MARLTDAEQVLLRSVLYLLKDSQQRDQAELPSASEARESEIRESTRRADGLLEDIRKLLEH